MLAPFPSLEAAPERHARSAARPVEGSAKEPAGDLQTLANTHAPCVRDALFADPAPKPSAEEHENVPARSTLRSRPYLFKVATPIRVDKFEALLANHPNQAFVRSVCYALRYGFWPWAETTNEECPTASDQPNRPPQPDRRLRFIAKQFRDEEGCSRFSPSFGPDLLPGVYSVPVHAVPKPRSEKLHMVVGHSAGPPAPNDAIDRSLIAGTKMDGMRSLGASLLEFREQHPAAKLVIFKSGVATAYPEAIALAAVTILAVEAYAKFGSLSCRYHLDRYLREVAGALEGFPAKRTDLLLLWGEIGLPHEEPKQVFGETFEVIGFIVDPNAASVLA
ncbi:hypothetical protein L210DRAFT_3653067 [Boletus edulis BED1]|uniref:Uncharacterized protein n=1 Tax=Boletus edulis BED1 TaxID=1328754 RepID=A0AAD4G7D8_BOLED|nr:hypothetical protein L210DRAFT_3653067 [Boletus edulis BED1]